MEYLLLAEFQMLKISNVVKVGGCVPAIVWFPDQVGDDIIGGDGVLVVRDGSGIADGRSINQP